MELSVVQRSYLKNDGSAGRDWAGVVLITFHIWLRNDNPVNKLLDR